MSFSGNLKRYDDFEHIVSMLEMTGGTIQGGREKDLYNRKINRTEYVGTLFFQNGKEPFSV